MNSAIGLPTQRFRRPQAAGKFPDPGSNHLFVESVDLAAHRFVRLGGIEVIGEVTSNKILRHCLLLESSSGGQVARLHYNDERLERNSTEREEKFLFFLARRSRTPVWQVLVVILGFGERSPPCLGCIKHTDLAS
jgi:hypothetical protein